MRDGWLLCTSGASRQHPGTDIYLSGSSPLIRDVDSRVAVNLFGDEVVRILPGNPFEESLEESLHQRRTDELLQRVRQNL